MRKRGGRVRFFTSNTSTHIFNRVSQNSVRILYPHSNKLVIESLDRIHKSHWGLDDLHSFYWKSIEQLWSFLVSLTQCSLQLKTFFKMTLLRQISFKPRGLLQSQQQKVGRKNSRPSMQAVFKQATFKQAAVFQRQHLLLPQVSIVIVRR